MRLVHVHEDKLYITVIDSKCGCAVYSISQSLSDLIEDPKQDFWNKLIAENVMCVQCIDDDILLMDTREHADENFKTLNCRKVVGRVSVHRYCCSATVLPNNKIMIIGYENDDKCSADIFTVNC